MFLLAFRFLRERTIGDAGVLLSSLSIKSEITGETRHTPKQKHCSARELLIEVVTANGYRNLGPSRARRPSMRVEAPSPGVELTRATGFFGMGHQGGEARVAMK